MGTDGRSTVKEGWCSFLREVFSEEASKFAIGGEVVASWWGEAEQLLADVVAEGIDGAVGGHEASALLTSCVEEIYGFWDEHGSLGDWACDGSTADVALTWPGSDGYFVRSVERHSPYAADIGGLTIRLEVLWNECNRHNNKPAVPRRYRFRLEDSLEVSESELVLRFDYASPDGVVSQTECNAASEEQILERVPARWRERLLRHTGGRTTALGRHLARFTRSESVDVFVWRNSRQVLRSAFDAFLRRNAPLPGEVSPADWGRWSVRWAIVRRLGEALIGAVAGTQERLLAVFDRPRWVLRADWIFADAAGDVVSTVGWEREQVLRRLVAVDGALDDRLAGTLFHGANRDALRLASARWRGRIQTIYMDPPYNTGDSGFRYHDRVADATWLSTMAQTLDEAAKLGKDNAFLCVSINEAELANLILLCKMKLGASRYAGLFSVRVRHDDRILKGHKELHEVLEYVVTFKLGDSAFAEGRWVKADDPVEYVWAVEPQAAPWRVEALGGKRVEVFAPGQYALRRVDPSRDALKRISVRGTLRKGNSSGRFYVSHVEPLLSAYQGCLLRVEGMGGDGIGHRWFWVPGPGDRKKNPDYFQGMPEGLGSERRVPFSTFLDFETSFNRVAAEGGVDFRDGKKPIAFLQHFLTLSGSRRDRSAVVLDAFGGSGSTAHAVMALNQEDDGDRRYLLTEMGDYVDTITMPRLEFATRELLQRCSGVRRTDHQIVRLPSFEEALESANFAWDPAWLRNPFRCRIPARRGGVLAQVEVDPIETLNQLLGWRVERYAALDSGAGWTVSAVDPKGQRVVAVWRDVDVWSNERFGPLFQAWVTAARREGVAFVYLNGGVEGLASGDAAEWVRPVEPVFASRLFGEGVAFD